MVREKFIESAHCTFNSRCKICRDVSQKGYDFRKSLIAACDLPSDNINFDCPHGMAWSGDKPSEVKAEYPLSPVTVIDRVSSSTSIPQLNKSAGCGCKGPTQKVPSIDSKTGESTSKIHVPNLEFMSNISRVQCPNCTRKHLAQAIINLQESIDGHPELRILAVGHLCEAYAECRILYPDIADKLSAMWHQMFNDNTLIPEILPIIEDICQRVEQPSNPGQLSG